MSEVNRKHRTAVVVDASNTSPGFANRVKRLQESLNGVNIKADLYTLNAPVASGNLVAGVQLDESTSDGATRDDVLTELREHGYVMAVFAEAL